jgi:SOS-response transcriptional repressor LexA
MSLRIGANSNQQYNNWVYRRSLPKAFYGKAEKILVGESSKDSHGLNATSLDNNIAFSNSNVRKLPVISFVKAGGWEEVMDPYSLNDAEDWIDWPMESGNRAYVLRIQGLSMFNPRTGEGYPDGSLVKVEPDMEAGHGDDVVVRTPDDQVTFKQLQVTNEGKFLSAINPDWPDPIIKIPEGSVICGVADGHYVPRKRK